MSKQNEPMEDENFNFIVRIANTDIDGTKNTVVGIQSIKGVGKRVAQIIVKRAEIDPSLRIGEVPEEKIQELEELLLNYAELVPSWAINRQMDYVTGADMHLIGSELEMAGQDDLNRMKMIRSYRGIRHET
ncbi:MAG TPA: 30S ribosomal protein S13, partial [Candidatus Methanomethylophilaceae archaeon]|nr:30S ribosomal protein S13 [Candidatus Methanomethylophilaceae archaeon]